MHEADYLGSVKIAFCFPFKMVLQDLYCVNSWIWLGFFPFVFLFPFFETAAGKWSFSYCVKFSEYWKEGELNSFCWPQIPSITTAHRGSKLHYVGFGDGTHPQLEDTWCYHIWLPWGKLCIKSRFTRCLLSVLPEESSGWVVPLGFLAMNHL